jgi:hypothetical protein
MLFTITSKINKNIYKKDFEKKKKKDQCAWPSSGAASRVV